MALTADPNDSFVVELGGRRLRFRHLTARQARRWREQLDQYLSGSASTSDSQAAETAAKLLQPYVAGDGDLEDALPESLLVLLPAAFELARQINERELGESCWRRICGEAPAAEGAATGDAPTNPTPPTH